MTTTRSIPITMTSQTRRLRNGFEKGHYTADEVAAKLTNPQFGWAQDQAFLPLTDAQWREVGKINGLVIR